MHRFQPRQGPTRGQSRPIADSIINKFEDDSAGYKINLVDFYQNATLCQGQHPDFTGDLASPGQAIPTTAGGQLPTCFFNLPVIKASVSPCLLVLREGKTLPANLGINRESCDLPAFCQQRPNACV